MTMATGVATRIDCPLSHVDVLGVRTAFYRAGSGPTLVLLHGSSPGACSDLNWFRNFNALAAVGYDVIAYDQPGYGLSAAPDDHTVEFRYQHAQAFLEALDIRSVVLIGNSLGGLLAVLLDHRLDPSAIRVKGLVLAAQYPHFQIPDVTRAAMQKHIARLASLAADFDSVKNLCGNTFADKRFITDDLVALRLSMLKRNYPAYLERGKVGMGFDAESVRAQSVTTNTLIVWGINDNSLPMAIGLEAFSHFNNAQFLFLPHCGHWAQTEHEQVFNRTVLAYLGDLHAAGS